MQTINAHELTPSLILKKYEKYDIGQTPYAILNQGGEARAHPVQVFDALEKNTQKETANEVRRAVLKMVGDNNQEQIERITNEMYEYLLNTEDTESWNEKVAWVFADNRLRFLRYLLDLPEANAFALVDKLMKRTDQPSTKRNFVEMVGVQPNEINPLYDVLIKKFSKRVH